MPRPRQQIPAEWVERPFAVPHALARGLRIGRLSEADLVVPFRGVRSASGALTHRRLLAAHALRNRDDLVVSHTSALLLWGAPLPRAVERESAIHLSTFGEIRPRMRHAIAHRLDAARCTTARLDGAVVTDPSTSWVLSAPLLDLDSLVAAGDFLVTGTHPFDGAPALATLDGIAEAVDRVPGARRIRRARDALALIRYGSLSRQETLVRLMLARGGLPEPALNHRVVERGRLVAMVDLAFVRERVAVEYESLLHMAPAKFRRDIRKQQELAAAGWTVHRLTSDDVDPHLRTPASRATLGRIERSLSAGKAAHPRRN